MSRSYAKLGIKEFGQHLLDSGDLDPVYIMLAKAELPHEQLGKWLMAYWCFYHCGVASWISEQPDEIFWDWMFNAGRNEIPPPQDTEGLIGQRWPRGHERRHFRGDNAMTGLEHLKTRYAERPCLMIEELERVTNQTLGEFKHLADFVKSHVGFGPWMAFKVADMTERVLGVNVNFDQAAIFMFKDPVEAALMLWRQSQGFGENVKPKDKGAVINGVVSYMLNQFRDYTAPPNHDRIVNLQEIETILCKWKSHMNGHYPLNNDIIEISNGLNGWTSVSKTAALMKACVPLPMGRSHETVT